MILVLALAAGGFYYVATADERSYREALELYEGEQYEEALSIFEEIGAYKDSEEKAERCRYELSVNGQFMRRLSEGLMKRWDKNNEYEKQGIIFEHFYVSMLVYDAQGKIISSGFSGGVGSALSERNLL